jgi:hypothetical protein
MKKQVNEFREAFVRRGLTTNLHEMGVPTKVIQRVCRHADEATTKKHHIHATEPGVRSGTRRAGSVDNTRDERETLRHHIVSC